MIFNCVTLGVTVKRSFASLDYLFCFTFHLADLLQVVGSGDGLNIFS